MHDRFLTRVLAAMVAVVFAAPALGDEFVDRVNERFAKIALNERADLVLLPALAGLESPPLGAETRLKASLAHTGSPNWEAASRWAASESQQAVLQAASEITQEQDPLRAMVFAQPYGIEALIEEDGSLPLIEAGLYTDLGDPPLLAAAKHGYLSKLDEAICLAHVEATRLAAEGQTVEACRVLADWILVGRQMADRSFYEESAWGLQAIVELQERIRDVLYEDWRTGRPAAGSAEIEELINRLDEHDGYLSLDRMPLPTADLVGADQLFAMTVKYRGEADPAVFAPTLARLASSDRPLRLFAEAAKWRDAAERHANWFDTDEAIKGVSADFEFRWTRSWHDPAMKRPFYYARLAANPNEWALVLAAVPDMRTLINLRQLARTESRGTTHALGLLAFHFDNRLFPRDLSGVRPRYVTQITADPFNPDRLHGRIPPFQYFVPMRDTAGRFGPREDIQPHQVTVIVPYADNVAIRLRDDEFVIYSTGADGDADWADEVQNTADAPPGRDYLIWPPVLSIVRTHLRQQGGG